jgi:hypothetical protein
MATLLGNNICGKKNWFLPKGKGNCISYLIGQKLPFVTLYFVIVEYNKLSRLQPQNNKGQLQIHWTPL